MTDARARDLERVWGPVGGIGAAVAQAELRRQDQENRERWAAERETRLAAAVEADRAEDERLAAAQRQRDAEARERAELELAGIRAAVEADLRAGGCPETDVRSLAAEAMTAYHAKRAVAAAARGPATEAQMREVFRRMGAAASRVE